MKNNDNNSNIYYKNTIIMITSTNSDINITICRLSNNSKKRHLSFARTRIKIKKKTNNKSPHLIHT